MSKEKREKFAEEYLVDLDPAAAYRRAGYEPRTDAAAGSAGRRLLQNVAVQARIVTLRAKQTTNCCITAQEVLAGLKKEATFEGEGSSHAARVAAWTALGKHLRLFVDRLEVTQEARLKIVKVVVVHADRSAAAGGPGGNGATASGPGGVLPQ